MLSNRMHWQSVQIEDKRLKINVIIVTVLNNDVKMINQVLTFYRYYIPIYHMTSRLGVK